MTRIVDDVSALDGFGGVGGWAVMEGGSDTAIEFLVPLTSQTNQRKLAALISTFQLMKLHRMPVRSPLTREVVRAINQSSWLQMYIENMQSPAVGQVMQNVVVDLMSNATTPREAMEKIQSVADLT